MGWTAEKKEAPRASSKCRQAIPPFLQPHRKLDRVDSGKRMDWSTDIGGSQLSTPSEPPSRHPVRPLHFVPTAGGGANNDKQPLLNNSTTTTSGASPSIVYTVTEDKLSARDQARLRGASAGSWDAGGEGSSVLNANGESVAEGRGRLFSLQKSVTVKNSGKRGRIQEFQSLTGFSVAGAW